MCLSTLIRIMIDWRRKIFFLEFALQMSTFLADIYIMIELKQEIFFLVFALQTFTFLADIYIMIEWRPIIISLLIFPLTLHITSFIPSLMFSKTKKPPCFHRTGKRQIIEGDMTDSKFLSPTLFISFWFVYSNGSVLLYS